jgi:hypothetical protein
MIVAGMAALGALLLARRGRLNRPLSLVLVVAAFLSVPIVEAADDASRAPYMVTMGNVGLPANLFANTMIPLSWWVAELAVTVAILVMATFFVGIYFIYKVRSGPITDDAV